MKIDLDDDNDHYNEMGYSKEHAERMVEWEGVKIIMIFIVS